MIITHNGNILTNDGVILNKVGGVSPSPFSNEYSMEFNGVDDRIDCGDFDSSVLTALSISVWVKTTFTTGGDSTNIGYIVAKDDVATSRDIILNYRGTGTNKINFAFWSPSGVLSSIASPTFPLGNPADGAWHHILATWDGTTDANKIQLFVDGNLVAQGTANDTGVRDSSTTELTIGGPDDATNTRLFYGNIDEVAIFNGDVSANVDDIYNLGVPTDLTSLNPLKWYRMGDNATFKDSQWLLPSNENKDKVSNYSMSFDGTDDAIIFPDDTTYKSILKNSISVWFKCTSLDSGTTYLFDTGRHRIGFISSTNQLRYQFSKSPNQDDIRISNLTITDGNWHHILACFDGSTRIANVFYDGVLVNTKNPTNNTSTDQQLYNGIGTDYLGTNRYFVGTIDEVAFWHDSDQSANVSTIYNGGTPSDLNSLPTGPTNWIRMGDGATWDGTNWTLLDEGIMSATPTSSNMDINARGGDAPNSENNALSYNIALSGRTTDVPT